MRIQLDKNIYAAELIETLLKMNFGIGEIQALYPLSTQIIRKFCKEKGIELPSRNSTDLINNRDNKKIAKLIRESIEKGIITETPRTESLLKLLETQQTMENNPTRLRRKELAAKIEFQLASKHTPYYGTFSDVKGKDVTEKTVSER